MGAFYCSLHFRSDNAEAIIAAAAKHVRKARRKMLVAPAKKGWVSAYPEMALMLSPAIDRIITAPKTPHAIAFNLHDSDVLCYWLFRAGRMVDFFNSCPDYFGKATKAELAATGNPSAFAGLLDKTGQRRLAKIIGPRMINGEEVGGPIPDLEDDRLESIAKVLGIQGVLGCYEQLKDGESIEGAPPASKMIEIA